MHPRMARPLYLLGGEVQSFQNFCVEGLNCGLYLFIYLFIYLFFASGDRGDLSPIPNLSALSSRSESYHNTGGHLP